MSHCTIQSIIVFAVGVAYWQFVAFLSGVGEPWDAASFATILYPGSLVLSALASVPFRKNRWTAGALITLAQLPIIWFNNGVGPLLAVGVVFLAALAVPAAVVAALSGWLADRIRSR